MIDLESLAIIQLIDELNLYDISDDMKVNIINNILTKYKCPKLINKKKLQEYYPTVLKKAIPQNVHESNYNGKIVNAILFEIAKKEFYTFNQCEIQQEVKNQYDKIINIG